MPGALNWRACMMLIASCRSGLAGDLWSVVVGGRVEVGRRTEAHVPAVLEKRQREHRHAAAVAVGGAALEDLEERDVERGLDRIVASD